MDHSLLDFDAYNANEFCNVLVIENQLEFLFVLKNYPNPFTHFSEIRFQLAQNEEVTLTVHDISGREIKEIIMTFKQERPLF